MKKLLLSLCTVLAVYTSSSQTTSIVKDVEPGVGSGMYYTYFTVMGTNAFFVGNTTANSYELWKTDATTGGTTMVKDINPGAGNANPSGMFVNNSKLYFLADNGTQGKELWKSDGTTAGTVLVKDIYAGANAGPYPYTFFGAIGTTIFFEADAGSTGYELWKSDGTTAGTVLVKDIYAGANSSFSSPSYAVTMGSNLYFNAMDAAGGMELWKTDGTTANTLQVKDIYAGGTGSYPENLTVIGSTLYFTATTAAGGKELWKSDGSTAGTQLVKDIYAGATSSNPINFYVFGTTLLFRAEDGSNGIELWKSDGTTAGTVMVKDIYAGSGDGYPNQLITMSGAVYFAASTSAAGEELWKTDGTTAGTTLVKDIYAGATSSYIANLTVVGTTLYFGASTLANGQELWKSNGTTAGTTLVRDIYVGTSGSSPSGLANMNGTLYFRANLNVNGQDFGSEIYKSDGTVGGTVLVDDMYALANSGYPENFLFLNSTIIFTASTATYGTEIFKVNSGYLKQAFFAATNTNVTSSSPFNHTDFLDQTPNDPISWAWTFTGGSPATSTAQNPTNIVYNTPGCYQVSMTATFASGSDNETKTCYITVVDINSLYCTVIGSGTAGPNYVNGVSLGTINTSNTGTFNGPSYTSFLGQTTNLTDGQTYTITIDGRGGSGASYAGYIDYNRDGAFDASEFLDQAWSWIDGSDVRTLTFTVPFGTYVGATRMRIRVADDLFSSTYLQLSGCDEGSWQDGENEDYTVVLSGGTTPVVDFVASNTSPSAGTTVDFTDLSTNTPISWSWSFPGGSPATSTLQDPTGILYSTPGYYNVTLSATNPLGTGTLTKTSYIHVLNPALAPVVDFVANQTTIAPAHTVTFTDLSTNSPTSWSWSFPGGSPATSTLQNPTISYSTAGVYNVTLTATNAQGSNTLTKPSYITVQGYCIPTSVSGTSAGDYINRVEVISLINGLLIDNNGTGGTGTYHDYTSSVAAATLYIGETYAMSAEGHAPSGSPNSYGVFFVDWNQDGDFDDTGERVFEQLLSGFDLVPWGWNTMGITIPATAAIGVTRMRARICRPSGANTWPCGSYNWSESEDYKFIIAPSVNAPVADFYATATTLALGGSTNFNDLSTNVPLSWSWSFPGGSPSTSTLQNPVNIAYSISGCYAVTLTATNASGTNTMTKPCYITVGTGGTGGGTCDTIANVAAGNNFVLYTAGAGNGYVTGQNTFGDLAKADYFTTYTAGNLLDGAFIAFARAKYATTSSSFFVRVWDNDGTGGTPGTVLSSKTVTYASLAADVAAGADTWIPFTSPVAVTGPFFLGIEFAYAAGDTVAMWTNTDGESPAGVAWEKWSSGSWYAYSDASGWNLSAANYIIPVLCSMSVGANEIDKDDVLIYPNPSSGLFLVAGFKFQIEGVKVFNMLGECVFNKSEINNSQSEISVDLRAESKGIYFVEVKTKNGIINKKIVKE